MRIIILIATLLANATAFCQSDTLNQTDADGKRQGHWIFYGVDRPEAGYPDSGKVEEGRYVDSRKSGVWIKYHKDGITPRLKGEYINNRPNGHYNKFYDTGTLQEEGDFYRGKYEGQLIRYHRNGEMSNLFMYDPSGRQVGDNFYFFDNGCREALYRYDTSGVCLMVIRYHHEWCDSVKETIPQLRSSCYSINKDIKFQYSEEKKKKPAKVKSWRSLDENYIDYSDAVICNELNENGEYLNPGNLLLFKGSCKDERVWNGKMYFYKKDGTLERTEIWRRGKYRKEEKSFAFSVFI